ncbi:hypothetical protein HMPREF0290_0764 [Corynebacterium efficiens YS-314]|nr:hypothetical protein HMPREF0290_0764 [Corynebacterium efficiens YS-314]
MLWPEGRNALDFLLSMVFLVLLVNFLVALIVVLRRDRSGGWLLVLLLSSTTGAALTAVFGLLVAEDASRIADVALIFTALAAVSAAVAVVAGRRRADSVAVRRSGDAHGV